MWEFVDNDETEYKVIFASSKGIPGDRVLLLTGTVLVDEIDVEG